MTVEKCVRLIFIAIILVTLGVAITCGALALTHAGSDEWLDVLYLGGTVVSTGIAMCMFFAYAVGFGFSDTTQNHAQ